VLSSRRWCRADICQKRGCGVELAFAKSMHNTVSSSPTGYAQYLTAASFSFSSARSSLSSSRASSGS
jgi:hypothetical protein